jgi:hypothetical protein
MVVIDQSIRRCPEDGSLMVLGVLFSLAWPYLCEQLYLCDKCGGTLPKPGGDDLEERRWAS